jgi:hypothetical protein
VLKPDETVAIALYLEALDAAVQHDQIGARRESKLQLLNDPRIRMLRVKPSRTAAERTTDVLIEKANRSDA